MVSGARKSIVEMAHICAEVPMEKVADALNLIHDRKVAGKVVLKMKCRDVPSGAAFVMHISYAALRAPGPAALH